MKTIDFAAVIAEKHSVEASGWLLWSGWAVMPGCNICRLSGPSASCWGRAECHGYANGCGCRECEQMRSLSFQTDEDWTE